MTVLLTGNVVDPKNEELLVGKNVGRTSAFVVAGGFVMSNIVDVIVGMKVGELSHCSLFAGEKVGGIDCIPWLDRANGDVGAKALF
jgi:hypothetical protein